MLRRKLLGFALLLSSLFLLPPSARVETAQAAEALPDFTQWTLDEQVGQLLIWGSTNRPEDLTLILEGDGLAPGIPIGGVLLTSKAERKRADVLALASFLRECPHTPSAPLLCADQEGGEIAALREGVRVAPSALQLSTLPFDARRDAIQAMAEDTHIAGIDILLAPVLDIDAEPLNPAIGKHERSFGGDFESVSASAAAFLAGTRLTGAVPVLKHFPGHGFADTDSHKTLPLVTQSRADWLKLEGRLYREYIDSARRDPANFPTGVMVGHLNWPALTGNTEPTCFSRPLIQQTLRKDLGLGDQVVWSDDIHMKALPDPVTSAIAMRKAGIDLILVSRDPATLRAIHKALVKYYANGWLDRGELDASLRRILTLKAYLRAHWAELPDPSTPIATREPQPFF